MPQKVRDGVTITGLSIGSRHRNVKESSTSNSSSSSNSSSRRMIEPEHDVTSIIEGGGVQRLRKFGDEVQLAGNWLVVDAFVVDALVYCSVQNESQSGGSTTSDGDFIILSRKSKRVEGGRI